MANKFPWKKYPKKSEAIYEVYFITLLNRAGPIKIGIAINPEGRFRQIQANCPYRLRLLGTVPGTNGDERKLHTRFAKSRLHGEWFSYRIMPEVRTILRRGSLH